MPLAGSGTSIHLAGALFADLASLSLEHLPYRGSAPAVTDLAVGRVDMMFDSVTSAGPHVASGRLAAVAVTTPQRIAATPELPTMAEAGVPGFAVDPSFAMLAPRALPAAARAPVSALLSRLLAGETARWGAFVRRAGIQPE